MPYIDHTMPMMVIQPNRPVSAMRNPSRAPVLVASSRNTEPHNTATPTPTSRMPRNPGFHEIAARTWLIGRGSARRGGSSGEAPLVRGGGSSGKAPLVEDDLAHLLLGHHAALLHIARVLGGDPDLT